MRHFAALERPIKPPIDDACSGPAESLQYHVAQRGFLRHGQLRSVPTVGHSLHRERP